MNDGLGAVAQLGERLVCNQEATGSIPVSSTRKLSFVVRSSLLRLWIQLSVGRQLRHRYLYFIRSNQCCLAPNIGLEELQ